METSKQSCSVIFLSVDEAHLYCFSLLVIGGARGKMPPNGHFGCDDPHSSHSVVSELLTPLTMAHTPPNKGTVVH